MYKTLCSCNSLKYASRYFTILRILCRGRQLHMNWGRFDIYTTTQQQPVLLLLMHQTLTNASK